MKEKIRIGILVDDVMIKLWQYRILRNLVDTGSVALTMLIGNAGRPVPYNNIGPFVYRFHEKLDRFMFRNRFDYDTAVDLADLNADVPRIILGSGDPVEEGSFEELEVILNFCESYSTNTLRHFPKYGIWTYKIGKNGQNAEVSPGYWETMKNLPVIDVAVSMLDSKGSDTVIYRTFGPTYPESTHLVRNQAYAFAAVIIPRMIKGLSEDGKVYLDKLLSAFSGEANLQPEVSSSVLSPRQALGNFFSVVKKKIGRKILYLNPDLWFIILSLQHDGSPFNLKSDSFIELIPPKGLFWADPFIISKDNKHYIFMEEYVYETDKGHLAVLEVDSTGVLLSSTKIIEKPYHMSYPFIFEMDKEYYMVPETMDNKNIELYRCKTFPNEWEFVMNLMEDIMAVDSTLFYHQQKWWMFTSIDETETWTKPFNELFLFHTDDLFSGKWEAHPGNPIVTDLRNSRQAGKVFTHNNKIYRPSQDCSERYGRAMKISQITELNENTYQETLVSEIEPTWNPELIGTHTINFDSHAMVLDACMRTRRKLF